MAVCFFVVLFFAIVAFFCGVGLLGETGWAFEFGGGAMVDKKV